jgi:glucan phosphoethanolaminetransferase (alkaline phosphatase superfamily)
LVTDQPFSFASPFSEPEVEMRRSSQFSRALWPLLALTVLLLPDLLWALRSDDPLYALQHGLAFSFCMLLGGFVWLRRRVVFLLWLGLPFALLVPFESYYIWRYSFPSSAHVLAIIGETNANEAREYLGNPLLGALLAGLLLIGLVYAIALSRAGTQPLFPEHRAWRWLGVTMLFPFISLAVGEVMLINSPSPELAGNSSDRQSQATMALLKDVRFGMDEVMTSSFPFGIPFRFSTYLSEQQRMDEARHKSRKIQVAATTASDSVAELVVLVIGESARPDHWHANGYPRQTTPAIEAIPEAVSLRNVLSPWPATRNAVPTLLTGMIDDQGLPPIAVPSVIDVYRAAGWETYWLSNQSPLGMHDSTIVLHAERAQHRQFVNGGDYSQASDFDGGLIPALDKVLHEGAGKKKLVILHLLGSHTAYQSRYPSSFAQFEHVASADDKIGGYREVHDQYDNSMLYTDYVLSQFIASIRATGKAAALIYASDHGQNLPDLECQRIGHGHPTEDTYRIAALTWLSPQFEAGRPGITERLRKRASAPFHLSEIFSTLLDLGGIEYAKFDRQRSWSDEGWQPGKRLIGNFLNFDTAEFSGACRVFKYDPPTVGS